MSRNEQLHSYRLGDDREIPPGRDVPAVFLIRSVF